MASWLLFLLFFIGFYFIIKKKNKTTYKVISKRSITNNAFELQIKTPTNFTLKPCQHVAAYKRPKGDIFRKYTPICFNNNVITLRIKRYPEEILSNYLTL